MLMLLMVLLIRHHLTDHLFIQASEFACNLSTGGFSVSFGALRPTFLLLSYDRVKVHRFFKARVATLVNQILGHSSLVSLHHI